MARTTTKRPAASVLRDKGFDDEAVALGTSKTPDVVPGSIAEAIAAERLRLAAILDHPEAVSRPALAKHFAVNTSLPADEVIAALSAAAPEGASNFATMQAGQAFERAMNAMAETINIAPALGKGAKLPGAPHDRRTARTEELAATARAYGEAKGYRTRGA